MKVISIFILFVAAFCAVQGDRYVHGPIYDLHDAGRLFEEFMEKYHRHYSGVNEYRMRYELFKKTLSYINKVNSDPLGSWFADINYMSDWTKEEYKHHNGPMGGPGGGDDLKNTRRQGYIRLG